LTENQSIYNT